MKTPIFPTEIPTEIFIPQDYPVPPVSSVFLINFHTFTPAGNWNDVLSVIQENFLTISEVDYDTIYLQEGAPVQFENSPEPEDYVDIFQSYWVKNPLC